MLNRKRVNKVIKQMNSLPLSPVVISYATLQGKLLPTSPFCAQQNFFGFTYNIEKGGKLGRIVQGASCLTFPTSPAYYCSAKLLLRPFHAQQVFFSLHVHITLTREVTLCPKRNLEI